MIGRIFGILVAIAVIAYLFMAMSATTNQAVNAPAVQKLKQAAEEIRAEQEAATAKGQGQKPAQPQQGQQQP
jgi:hypothetical protein